MPGVKPNVAAAPPRAQTAASPPHRDAFYIGYIFLLCQPYILWLGQGTPSDVQIYPMLFAAPFLAHCLLSKRMLGSAGHRTQHRDLLLLGLTVAVIPIAVLHSILSYTTAFATLRGLFGYLSIGILTWAWVWVIRSAGPDLTIKGLKVSFWVWAAAGAAQLVQPSFATLWRTRLTVSDDRGAISFASEPAYFAFALLLTAIAIGLLSRTSRYLIYATLLIAFVARSSVGLVYCFVAALVVSRLSVGRKLALVGTVGALWFAAITLLPETRVGTASAQLFTDPFGLIATDPSAGSRYINIVYPIQGFLQDYGLPHGLTSWPTFAYHAYLARATDYSWQLNYGRLLEGNIISVHGQLLFQLGLFAFVYYALFWKIIRRSEKPVGLALIGATIFINGVTLSSPFLALIMAAAYVQREFPTYPQTQGGQGSRDRRATLKEDRIRRDYLRPRPVPASHTA